MCLKSQTILLQPYLNEIAFKIENEQFTLDFSRVIATFNQVHGDNPQKALVDLAELMGYAKIELQNTGLPELLATYFALADESTLADVVPMLDKKVMETLDLHFSGTDKANVSGSSKNDFLIGDKADNVLNANSGNDFLIGGTGNDTLNGSYGNDAYVFAKGHGQDIISDYGSDKNDSIRFIDVASTEVQFRKEGNHLILEGYHEQDSIQIQNFFADAYYQIENFQFSDKTVTLQEYFENGLTLTQSNGDDKVFGWSGKNILLGNDGNDTLTTYDKDDVLDGGDGNDVLNAGSGSDTLIGGAGNDTLNGSYGQDTYVFTKGHGQDTINDYGSDKDMLVFTDVVLSDVTLAKQGSNLLLSSQNGQDTVLVKGFFSDSYYQVEKLVFEDQTVNVNATELNRALSGAANMVSAMAAFGENAVSATD